MKSLHPSEIWVSVQSKYVSFTHLVKVSRSKRQETFSAVHFTPKGMGNKTFFSKVTLLFYRTFEVMKIDVSSSIISLTSFLRCFFSVNDIHLTSHCILTCWKIMNIFAETIQQNHLNWACMFSVMIYMHTYIIAWFHWIISKIFIVFQQVIMQCDAKDICILHIKQI